VGAGVERERIDGALPSLWDIYIQNLRREIRAVEVRPLPGIIPLIERIEAAGEPMLLGVLTGNVAEGARIKLNAAGLAADRFRVGAFGSDHAHRPELPAIAVERARRLTGIGYAGKEVVIIGDTPRDVACGAHLGVRTIATATGRHPLDELRACGPDHAFADLGDVDAVWQAIAA